MHPIIIANWKMNLTLSEAIKFCEGVIHANTSTGSSGKGSPGNSDNLIIAPPAPYLSYLSMNFKNLKFASQNVSKIDGYGAYTGEYSSAILKETHVNYAIVGHSERRSLSSESNDDIKQKVENCLKDGIVPIICIGETLEARQRNTYKSYILNQLESLNIDSTKQSMENLSFIIAYEPIWSIGTGTIPETEELVEIFDIIDAYLRQSVVAKNFKLVYGGSVNLENVQKILNVESIHGVLMGKASLDYTHVVQILNKIKTIQK